MSNVKRQLQKIAERLSDRKKQKENLRVLYVFENRASFFTARGGFKPAGADAAAGLDKIGRTVFVNVDPQKVIGITKEEVIPDAQPLSDKEDEVLGVPVQMGNSPEGGSDDGVNGAGVARESEPRADAPGPD